MQPVFTGGRERTVRIRRNSHYRIKALLLSRNACRLVNCKRSSGKRRGWVICNKSSLIYTFRTLLWRVRFLLFMGVKEGFFMKNKNANKITSFILALLMCVSFCFTLAACKEETETPDVSQPTEVTVSATSPDEYAAVWADAVYTEDTVIGEGSNNFFFEVKVGTHSVTFTVNTDETMVGAALLDNEIIAGDDGPYGLYVKTVNGILADYDINATYWGFYQNGEYMMTGVDSTEIENGAHYEMVYEKG